MYGVGMSQSAFLGVTSFVTTWVPQLQTGCMPLNGRVITTEPKAAAPPVQHHPNRTAPTPSNSTRSTLCSEVTVVPHRPCQTQAGGTSADGTCWLVWANVLHDSLTQTKANQCPFLARTGPPVKYVWFHPSLASSRQGALTNNAS